MAFKVLCKLLPAYMSTYLDLILLCADTYRPLRFLRTQTLRSGSLKTDSETEGCIWGRDTLEEVSKAGVGKAEAALQCG